MGAKCMPCCKETEESNVIPTESDLPGLLGDFDLKETGIARVDTLLRDARTILKILRRVQDSLTRAYARLQKITATVYLIEPTLKDSVMAMLFIYSASSRGHLERVGFEMGDKEPFISVCKDSLLPEHQDIAEAWNDFAAALTESGPKLATLKTQLTTLVKNFVLSVKDIEENPNFLGCCGKLKATKVAKADLALIKQAPKVAKS